MTIRVLNNAAEAILAPAPSGDTTGVTDTNRIQSLLDNALSRGYSRIALRYAPRANPYYIDHLALVSLVELVGESQQATVLKAPLGHSTTPMVQLTDVNTYGWAIRNLAVDGSNGNINTDGTTQAQTNQFHGIYIVGQTPNDGRFFGPFKTDMNGVIEDVMTTQVSGSGMYFAGRASEIKIVRCYSYANNARGYYCGAADLFFNGCTAGGNGAEGFLADCVASQFVNCKSWWNGRTSPNAGNGFCGSTTSNGNIFEGCFAQDNFQDGFQIIGSNHRVTGQAAGNKNSHVSIKNATNCQVDLALSTAYNNVQHATYVMDWVGTNSLNNVIIRGDSAATNPYPTGATLTDGNSITFKSNSMTKALAYSATTTLDPFSYDRVFTTLTGNISYQLSGWKGRYGQELTLFLTQGTTGGWTTSFSSDFATNWTPDTTAGKTNVIRFVHNGTKFVQVSATPGLS